MTTAHRGHDRFFIIGAQRSGTTSLYEALDSHPVVMMARPVRPEPKHFLDEGAEEPASLRTYEEQYFPEALRAGARLFGEKSTTYIERPDAADRIHAAYPAARIVVSLREPVARALSNYRFSVASGYEDRPMSDALTPTSGGGAAVTDVSTSPFEYLGRSHYERHLPAWLDRFGDQVCVLVFEELQVGGARRELEQFLDLEAGSLSTLPVENATERETDPSADPPPLDYLRHEFEQTVQWVEDLLGRRVDAWRRR